MCPTQIAGLGAGTDLCSKGPPPPLPHPLDSYSQQLQHETAVWPNFSPRQELGVGEQSSPPAWT